MILRRLKTVERRRELEPINGSWKMDPRFARGAADQAE